MVCDTWFNNIYERGSAHIYEITSFLKEKGAFWRVLPELVAGAVIKKFFERYKIIVSVWLVPPLDSLSFDDWFSEKKSVRVLYGTMKNLATFAPWTANFDKVLAYGDYSQKYLCQLSESHIVGNPKFDDWFGNTLDDKAINILRTKLDPNKQTVLYLPTHSNLSSLPKFGDAVRDLKSSYNVLIKFHNHNHLTESEAVRKIIADKDLFTFNSKDDILTLFAVADIVISDASSVVAEAVLVDKPLVILDTTSDKDFWNRHLFGPEFNGFWHSGGLVSSNSMSERVKKQDEAISKVISNSDELMAAVMTAESDGMLYAENRKKLKSELFSFNDGKCGERAARIIKDFLREEKPEKPLLGAAVTSFFPIAKKNYEFTVRQYDAKIAKKDKRIAELTREIQKQLSTISLFEKIKKEKNIFMKMLKIIRNFF